MLTASKRPLNVTVAKRLSLQTSAEIEAFAKSRKWVKQSDGYFTFEIDTSKTSEALPSLVEKTIFYAKELEMIV